MSDANHDSSPRKEPRDEWVVPDIGTGDICTVDMSHRMRQEDNGGVDVTELAGVVLDVGIDGSGHISAVVVALHHTHGVYIVGLDRVKVTAVHELQSLRRQRDEARSEHEHMRRELAVLRDDLDRHAHESEGDLFDDLMTRVLARYARRVDAILKDQE